MAKNGGNIRRSSGLESKVSIDIRPWRNFQLPIEGASYSVPDYLHIKFFKELGDGFSPVPEAAPRT